jgi:hypothetical protein
MKTCRAHHAMFQESHDDIDAAPHPLRAHLITFFWPAESQIFDFKSNNVVPAIAAHMPAVHSMRSVAEEIAAAGDSYAQMQPVAPPPSLWLRQTAAENTDAPSENESTKLLAVKEATLDQRIWTHEGTTTMEFSVECARIASGVRLDLSSANNMRSSVETSIFPEFFFQSCVNMWCTMSTACL